MVVQKTNDFVFCTFNAKGAFGGMSKEHIKHDLETLNLRSKQKLGRELDVLGLQEFWPEDYHKAINEVLGATLADVAKNSVAVWFNNSTREFVSKTSHYGHGAVIIDGKVVADPRPIEVVITKDRETGLRLATISGHPVPGGFLRKTVNGKVVPVYKSGWKKRRAAWREWRANLIKVMKDLSARGLMVVVMLDANKSFPPNLLGTKINGQTLRYVRNGIDWLVFLDSAKHKWVIDRTSKWIVKALFSDHDAVMVLAKAVAK